MYVHYFKTLPSKKNIIRSCSKKCYNPKHFIFQTNDINYDVAWNRLKKKGSYNENGCLLWNGSVDKDGYGYASFNGKTQAIHVISFKIKKNILSVREKYGDGKCVRHMCGNRICYNPEHLKIGTFKENNYDDKIITNTLLIGEKHPRNKISEELAIKIKHSKYPPKHELYKTVKERSIIFGVSEGIINHIDSGVSWNWIPNKDGEIKKSKKYTKKGKSQWTDEMFERAKIKIQNTHKKESNGCWKWLLSLDKGGYGTICINGNRKKAHVVSCEIKYGYVKPNGYVVRHLCNNTWCINPEHLEFGTFLENNIDTIKNESNKNNTPLNTVIKIRETYKKDLLSSRQRAEKYGVSLKVLSDIEKGKTFKNI